MLCGLLGELDARHLEIPRSFLQEKAVGASKLQEPAIAGEAADEIDAARELPAQHPRRAKIIGITVGMAAGEIVPGVVGCGVEAGDVGAAETAAPALQDVATVGLVAKQMGGLAAA